MMDCSKSYGNLGCKGGFEDAALTYAMDKGNEHNFRGYFLHQNFCIFYTNFFLPNILLFLHQTFRFFYNNFFTPNFEI